MLLGRGRDGQQHADSREAGPGKIAVSASQSRENAVLALRNGDLSWGIPTGKQSRTVLGMIPTTVHMLLGWERDGQQHVDSRGGATWVGGATGCNMWTVAAAVRPG